jgi:hypothetical protein
VGEKSSKDVQQLHGKGSIIIFVKGARLEWADHGWRGDSIIIKMVLVNKLNKKRPRGRPKQRWLDIIQKRYAGSETRLEWRHELYV